MTPTQCTPSPSKAAEPPADSPARHETSPLARSARRTSNREPMPGPAPDSPVAFGRDEHNNVYALARDFQLRHIERLRVHIAIHRHRKEFGETAAADVAWCENALLNVGAGAKVVILSGRDRRLRMRRQRPHG